MSRRARHALLLALILPSAGRAETCRFAGTTSQDGRLAVQTDVRQMDGQTTIDVTLEFSIHSWITDYRYLAQEITRWRGSDWRDAELLSVAVNQRSLADGDIKRQQWDVFTRNGLRFEARRVQAKYLTDFRRSHASFVQHWPPAAFGQPWLADYDQAAPERRPDLDLPADGARTPLAFAFYWSRFLPQSGGPIAVILPSAKRDKTTMLHLGPAAAGATAGESWRRWATELHHPALLASPASLAAVWVSPDHHLLQLALDGHTIWASGRANLRSEGCTGVSIGPG